MLFYDFNITFQSKKARATEQQKTKGHFVSHMRELNDILGMERMEEELQAFIYQESTGKYNMLAAVDQLQRPS